MTNTNTDDDRQEFCHNLRHDGHWITVDVDSAEAAARDAAHEYADEIEQGHHVLVGRCDWMGPEDLSRRVSASSVIHAIDDRIYELTDGRGDLIRDRVSDEQEGRLQGALRETVEEWLESIALDTPEMFIPVSVEKFEVVRHPDADDGPEVRRRDSEDAVEVQS